MDFRHVMNVVAAVVITTMAVSSASAQEVTLRYAGTLPASHHMTDGQKLFAKLVAEKTGGQVKVEVYPSGQLYKAHDIPTAVASGALDIGDNLTNVWTADAISELNDLPFLFRDARHAAKAWEPGGQLFEAYTRKMAKRRMKPLGVMFFGSLFDFSMRDRALVKAEDFKGTKIRSYGALASESLRLLGASPVTMDPGEMYLAIQSGTIDGAITGVSSIDSRKLWEAGKETTVAQVAFGVFAMNMNLAKFNSLSEKNQKALLEAGKEAFLWSVDESIARDKKSTEFLRTKGNVTILTPEQKQKWAVILEPVYASWGKRADAEDMALVKWVKGL